MACPKVPDRVDGLRTWMVAADTLNKQSRAADKRRSSSMGVKQGVATPDSKKKNLLLGLGWILLNDLGK
jgi:hypothetical protein